MSGFSVAWQFLTILPWIKRNREATPQLMGRSLSFYPLIGVVIGGILWGAYSAFYLIFPGPLCSGLVILLLVLITGAFHLDGLADTLDGLAFGKTPQERLRIMKDHQLGTFGVVGLILVLGIKFLALQTLPPRLTGLALLIALSLSRWSMVQLIYRAPYARAEGGLGLAFKEQVKKGEMVAAAGFSLAISFLTFRFWGVLLWLSVGIFTLLLQTFFQRKIGGVTGDILGAASEVNEVLILVLISGMLPAKL